MGYFFWPPNRRQVVCLGLVAITWMLLVTFPPFEFVTSRGTINLGYGFLFSPPRMSGFYGSVNSGLLAIQLLGATLVFGIIYALLGLKAEQPSSTSPTPRFNWKSTRIAREDPVHGREGDITRINWKRVSLICVVNAALAVLVWRQNPEASTLAAQWTAEAFGAWFYFTAFGLGYALVYKAIQFFRKATATYFYRVWLVFSLVAAYLTFFGLD